MLFARIGAFASVCLCLSFGASPRSAVPPPAAIATNADVNYCFARVRGLDPSRLPPAYLVVQLRVRVVYRNSGDRPLILPLEHQTNVYTSIQPGVMKKFLGNLLDQTYKPMTYLTPDVNPDNPVSPKNDVFKVIPAGGEMEPALVEEVTLPVNHKLLFRTYPDLRGHKVYIRIQYAHRDLAPTLEASLSDRWARFGVPWTGTVMTNVFTIDVPANPKAAPCKDNYTTVGVEPPKAGK